MNYLPARFMDYTPMIQQLRLARNPWHCDCASSYLAVWLQQRRYRLLRANATADSIAPTFPSNSTAYWEFAAGAICRGPGNFGGKLLVQLTFHELCEGSWASMRGLAPRIPMEGSSTAPSYDDND